MDLRASHTSVLKTFHKLVYLQLSDVSIPVSLEQLIVILIFKFRASDVNLRWFQWFHLGREGLYLPYFIFDQDISETIFRWPILGLFKKTCIMIKKKNNYTRSVID